jgi:hypothetical protein
MLRAMDVIGEPNKPIELHSLEIDDSGSVCRRSPNFPLTFSFTWRDCDFKGSVNQTETCMTLELSLNLGEVPYTAQDAARRGKWTAVISQVNDPEGGLLKIMRNGAAVLKKSIDLPAMNGFTPEGFIINTSMMVLSLAPYLDLIAEVSEAA